MLGFLVEFIFASACLWLIYRFISKAWNNLPLEEKLEEIKEVTDEAAIVEASEEKAKDLEKNREKIKNFVKK